MDKDGRPVTLAEAWADPARVAVFLGRRETLDEFKAYVTLVTVQPMGSA